MDLTLEQLTRLNSLSVWCAHAMQQGPITQAAMAALTGASIRSIQRAVASLRAEGVNVISDSQRTAAPPAGSPAEKPATNAATIPAIDTADGDTTTLDGDVAPAADDASLPAIIPDNILLHIPTRPGLDTLLDDPAQDVGTPPETTPIWNRGIPRRFREELESPRRLKEGSTKGEGK